MLKHARTNVMTKQLITPELANEWVTAYFYEKPLMHSVMRNIRETHVNYLAREMTRGMFGSATIAFADCKENGRRFIVNGNHTLRAIVQSGVNMYLTVEVNECDTVAQVRHLYATYDKNLLRQRVDSLRAYGASDTLEIRHTDVKVLAAAVAFMSDDFGATNKKPRIPDAELLDMMRPWTKHYGRLLVAVGSGAPWFARIMNRRAVLSVALHTMKHQPDISFRFWESVVSGAGFRDYAPALKLRDYLIETTLVGDHGRTKPGDMAKAVAYCWNKHLNNERIVQMRVPYDKPLEIAKTSKAAPSRMIQKPVTSATVGELVPA